MSPEPVRPPDDDFPRETRPGSGDEDDGVEPVPLFAPGSRDDGFGLLPPDDRGIPLGSIDPDAVRPGHGTADFLAEIDTNPTPLPPRSEDGDDGEDADDEPATSTSWPMVLLGSYASAVTLALAWVLLTRPAAGPGDVGPTLAGPAEAPAAAEPVSEEARGRKVEPVAAIPADHMARFGETLRVGSLEVTPQEVKRQPVVLRRLDLTGRAVETLGRPGTIVLRLKLRNASTDLAFAPLDPAFVRQRDQEVFDCYAETSGGERIYPYPLAVASELSIVGQDFGELRPGESRVVTIATAPDAPRVDPSTLNWRLRLRTGLDRIEAIGVAPASSGPAKPR